MEILQMEHIIEGIGRHIVSYVIWLSFASTYTDSLTVYYTYLHKYPHIGQSLVIIICNGLHKWIAEDTLIKPEMMLL